MCGRLRRIVAVPFQAYHTHNFVQVEAVIMAVYLKVGQTRLPSGVELPG